LGCGDSIGVDVVAQTGGMWFTTGWWLNLGVVVAQSWGLCWLILAAVLTQSGDMVAQSGDMVAQSGDVVAQS
jgi:hypothetical protein